LLCTERKMTQIVAQFLCMFAVVAISFGQSIAGGQMVRQCSCDELDKCKEDMKVEGQKCANGCWKVATQITSTPEQLQKCFEGKADQADTFVNCFKESYLGCAASMNGAMIPMQSFEGVVLATEANIRNTAKSLTVPGLTDQLSGVIQTAEDFGACFKGCVRRKAFGGVCIKKYNCQPLLPTEAEAKVIEATCTRGINFKKQAGPLCNCALNAGVSDLAQYCPILALMGNQG